MSIWNGEKFSIYKSKEKEVLGLIKELGDQTNFNTDTLNQKTDLWGDHKGTWQGLERPTLSDEGMRAVVEKLEKEYNKLFAKLTGILNINAFEGDTKEERFINAIKYTQTTIDKDNPTQGIRPKLFVPSGHYDFTGHIIDGFTIDNLNHPISIIGESAESVIFDYSKCLKNEAFFRIINASGTLRQNTIENITFMGNDTTTVVEFENTCGTKFVNCFIGKNAVGGKFINSGSGGFTEFVGFKECQFTGDCEVVAEYIKNGTDISFHGTGLEKCLINQSDNSAKASIIINNGAFPYNAPLDFTIWTRGNRPIISNFSGSHSVNFFGDMKVEPFNEGDVYVADKTGYEVLYNGTISSNNQKVKLGRFVLCSRIQVNSDLSANAHKRPSNKHEKLGNKTAIIGMATCETYIIDLQIRSSNFEIQHTLICTTHLAAPSGGVTIIAKSREFNNRGLQLPSYTVENNILYINGNYEGQNVDAYATVTQIGNRTEYFML